MELNNVFLFIWKGKVFYNFNNGISVDGWENKIKSIIGHNAIGSAYNKRWNPKNCMIGFYDKNNKATFI